MINLTYGCVGYDNYIILSPFYEHAENNSITLNRKKICKAGLGRRLSYHFAA